MELLEVLKKLANHYQYGIDNLPKDDKERDDFLCEQKLLSGMCKCSLVRFDFELPVNIFEGYRFEKVPWLFETPILEPYETAKDLLQKRLNVLNELIIKYEKEND